jgi:hypothetical protein
MEILLVKIFTEVPTDFWSAGGFMGVAKRTKENLEM